ncbi:MAG: lectin like domain-containing protein, partial [Euryarchaeota archaeon]
STATSTPTTAGEGQISPVSPAWTEYMAKQAAGTVATQTPDGKGLGNIPTPVDLSQVNAGKQSDYAATYPASYDLRNYGKVSPVGDQKQCGSCWTFATYGSLESYLRPGSTTQYSEKAMNNRNGFGYGCCNGGTWLMSTAYLARWGTTTKYWNGGKIYTGPVTSTSDPYTTTYCTDTSAAGSPAKHVQKVVLLPAKTSALSNNAIKYGLQTYGALYTSFQWEGSSSGSTYYKASTAAYYDGTTTGGNHAITIVGWNDNYAKTNFATKPAGNGAYICKNSWGTTWGKSGYFYVSYYDKNMGKQTVAAFTAESTTNYKTNYQYDPLGWVSNYGFSSTTGWGANTYTAKAGGTTLKAVGFYAPVKNTAYTIKVYKDPSSTNPTSGTLVTTKTGTVSYVGYYTTALPKSVPLTAGHRFSVVIKFTTPGYNYPVPISMYKSGYTGNIPDSVVGHSFASKTGVSGSWSDYAKKYDPMYGIVNDIHAFAS